MTAHPTPLMSLYGHDGRRKYLAPGERARFIATASAWPDADDGSFCLLLAYTGCRISEGLALTRGHIDDRECLVAIRTLKKRERLVVREIPVPSILINRLPDLPPEQRMWQFSRCRAWHLVKAVMEAAGIASGIHACPKGLRHAYGVHAIRVGIPLHLVQRWLGHANLATTAIYTQALGAEEQEIAARMW